MLSRSSRVIISPSNRTALQHIGQERLELLLRETPDFITVDHKVWSVLQERVYRSRIRLVEHLKERLMEDWSLFSQNIVNVSVKQWRVRITACVKADGGHFEHQLS